MGIGTTKTKVLVHPAPKPLLPPLPHMHYQTVQVRLGYLTLNLARHLSLNLKRYLHPDHQQP